MRSSLHLPVLLNEVLQSLRADAGTHFLDCTLGGGGHTEAFLKAAPQNWVVAVDRDETAVHRAERELCGYNERLEIHHGAFSEIPALVRFTKFDGILADLGVSTDQLKGERGFSFRDAGQLDMRMDTRTPLTAHEIVNEYEKHDLFKVLARGGVTGNVKGLVAEIVGSRPINSATELAEAVTRSSYGKMHEKGGHPATVVFQALRIEVNQEFTEIEALLDAAPGLSKPGGRLAVITFHSLEDKLVTRRMREWESRGSMPASWRGPRDEKALGRLITKKAIFPTEEEVTRNPAARSARLRVFEFV